MELRAAEGFVAPDYLEHGTAIMWIHVRVDRPTFWADCLKLRTHAYLALCFSDAVVLELIWWDYVQLDNETHDVLAGLTRRAASVGCG